MACKQNKTKIFLASLNQLPVSTYEYKQNNKKTRLLKPSERLLFRLFTVSPCCPAED